MNGLVEGGVVGWGCCSRCWLGGALVGRISIAACGDGLLDPMDGADTDADRRDLRQAHAGVQHGRFSHSKACASGMLQSALENGGNAGASQAENAQGFWNDLDALAAPTQPIMMTVPVMGIHGSQVPLDHASTGAVAAGRRMAVAVGLRSGINRSPDGAAHHPRE